MIYFRDLDKTKIKLDLYPARKNKKAQKWIYECDTIFCFDIEVSQGFYKDGAVIPYHAGEKDDYWNDLEIVTLPYIWQLAINDIVVYGREIIEISEFLDDLIPDNVHAIIFVHNLGYEFVHLLNAYCWKKVFARKPHHPISAVPANRPNIEFRCTLALTHMSLKQWGKSLNIEKLEMDYDSFRTPYTKLAKEEMDYSERDVQIMVKGIRQKLETYKHVERIPLTQTGQVRRSARSRMIKDPKTGKQSFSLCKRICNMLPQNVTEYQRLRKTFRGGDVHANFLYIGEILEAWGYDFASSYPYVMCSEKFPMTPFTPATYDSKNTGNYAYLMEIEMINVRPKPKMPHHYLSEHKCDITGKRKINNGRIMCSDQLTTWITEQDMDIIENTYDCQISIKQCYRSRKAYLPIQLIDYILELYENKTKLKNVEDPILQKLYALAKEYINSIYGMMVTDLIFDDILYKGGLVWDDKSGRKTIDQINDYLKNIHDLEVYPLPFLNYAWGVWVTAYARHNLWSIILKDDNALFCIYNDTDSAKMSKPIDVTWYNKLCDFKLKSMCTHYNINFERTRPADKDGTLHPLGWMECEGHYSEFCTLGAKRYAYRDKKGLHITVAGINKEAVGCLNNDIRNFTSDLKFDKDSPYVEKKLSIYSNNMPPVTWNIGAYDEYTSTLKYGLLLRPTGYSMGLNDFFLELINMQDGDRLKIMESVLLDRKEHE